MLKSVLDRLSKSDKGALFNAFEEGLPYMINLPGNQFIGVNVIRTPEMEIIEEKGVFVLGGYK
jgi:hypothetical protein